MHTVRDSECLRDGDESEDDSKSASEEAYDVISGKAVWCADCEMYLNSPTQWGDHKTGKKHKKNTKKSNTRKDNRRKLP